MQKGLILILVLAVLIGIFVISNSGVVSIDFIFTKVMISQAIVIFICVLLGAILATLFGGIRQMSLKKEIKNVKVELKTLQSENEKLLAESKMLRTDNEKLLMETKMLHSDNEKLVTESNVFRSDNEKLHSEVYEPNTQIREVEHSSFLDRISSSHPNSDSEITDI